jgi:hypothetical protein
LLTAKNASSIAASSSEAVVEAAENMKIILLGQRKKQGVIEIKTPFFRGKTKNHARGRWLQWV